jgi:hypothetical protein
MHADTVIAAIAVIIAVTVPWMTFRLAMRQDQARWLREQRTQLYVDMLTEAYAEEEYLHYAMADDEARERRQQWFTDLRMPPVERARLGARGTAFGSRAVNQAFNSLGPVAFSVLVKRDIQEYDRMVARMEIATWREALEKAVRRELGADNIDLDGRLPSTPPPPLRPAARPPANPSAQQPPAS